MCPVYGSKEKIIECNKVEWNGKEEGGQIKEGGGKERRIGREGREREGRIEEEEKGEEKRRMKKEKEREWEGYACKGFHGYRHICLERLIH